MLMLLLKSTFWKSVAWTNSTYKMFVSKYPCTSPSCLTCFINDVISIVLVDIVRKQLQYDDNFRTKSFQRWSGIYTSSTSQLFSSDINGDDRTMCITGL